jgi:hypothetical protein
MRSPSPVLLLLVCGAGGLVLGSLGRAQGPPPAPTPPPARVRSFAGGPSSWIWLREQGGDRVLMAGSGAGEAREVARDPGLTEVALSGADYWVLSPTAGLLLRGRVGAAEPPTAVVTGLRSPGGLLAADGGAYWLEKRGGESPLAAFVPAVAGVLSVRSLTAAGQTATLGEWHGAGAAPAEGDLIGVTPEAAYLRIRRRDSTEFVRLPRDGAAGRRVAAEVGAQEGLLVGGRLYWTAASPEATPSAGVRAVRREGPAGPEAVSDWLPATGTLLTLSGRPYYAARRLYRLPPTFGASVAGGAIPGFGRVVAAGDELISLSGAVPQRLSGVTR